VVLRAYRQAVDLWRRHGLPVEELAEGAPVEFPHETQVLVTGTSVNGVDLEKQFILAARANGIASIALLDFWSNYRLRFSSREGRLDCFPDRVAVMDTTARREMIEEGFDPARLVVTGQPAFDDLGRWRAAFPVGRRAEVRRAWKVEEDASLVLFASQPISTLCRGAEALLPDPGYDELTVAGLLVSTLEKISAESRKQMTLVIRPHPREDAAAFEQFRSAHVDVRVSREGDVRELIMAADLVAGMSTVLLVEACYLGAVVVSLQPNLNETDSVPTNRLGFSRAIYRAEEVLPSVRELLCDEAARARVVERLENFQSAGDAAEKVADLVEEFARSTRGAETLVTEKH
jgi:hypothetical protein